MTPKRPVPAPSAYLSLFESLRAGLDAHHDKRDRIIKTSRDITSSAKKLIFSLQRTHTLPTLPHPPPPAHALEPHMTLLKTHFSSLFPHSSPPISGTTPCTVSSVASNSPTPAVPAPRHHHFRPSPSAGGDVAFTPRYAQQISPGVQETIEALAFAHYLTTQRILSYREACQQLRELCQSSKVPTDAAAGEEKHNTTEESRITAAKSANTKPTEDGRREDKVARGNTTVTQGHDHGSSESNRTERHFPDRTDPGPTAATLEALLPVQDYILGLFDTLGELSRYAITTAATTGLMPCSAPASSQDSPPFASLPSHSASFEPRTITADMRTLLAFLETLRPKPGIWGAHFERDVEGKKEVAKRCIERVEGAAYAVAKRKRPGMLVTLGEDV